jgi:UDP-3-O-[3-hydroxymyristoyl] glucosamine N-acyltransferase
MSSRVVKTLADIARVIGGEVHGDGAILIERVATLEKAGPGDISFLANPRYYKYLMTTNASAVILAAEHLDACLVSAVVVKDPYLGYARAVALLNPPSEVHPGIHPTASIAPGACIHPSASIGPACVVEEGVSVAARVVLGPGCYVGRGALIGEDSRFIANVSVCHDSVIGKRAQIQPGVVIGGDGFGLANDAGVWVKIPQLGRVVIGDDVEIGANTTIDRGALEDTVLEDGVKLDNQIQVAHNVRIGAHTVIAGCTGISGSTRIGKRCVIGGAVGFVGHIEITDDVHITGMSFVHKSITAPGVYSSGTPLEPTRKWRKNFVRFRQLNELARRVHYLETLLANKMEKEEPD